MKNIFKAWPFLLLATVLVACEKDDSKASYGEPMIYMPQASIAAGRYDVPNTGVGLDSATRNFSLTPDSVRIILGANHSGSGRAGAVSVDVFSNADTVAALITNGVFPEATTAVLPDDIYSVPASVNIAPGSGGQSFVLSIDRAKLKEMFTDRKVLMAVGLRNPSAFVVNAPVSQVIVVIDVNALQL